MQHLSNGHGPLTRHNNLRNAIYAFDDRAAGAAEPPVETDGGTWQIGTIFEHMRHCDAILPTMLVSKITSRLSKPWQEITC
jgi:hypothetical protein